MMKRSPLKIFAGKEALAHIKRNGLASDQIAVILAASGGPKWLALASIDRFLLEEWFRFRQRPLHLLGTSAGAWRMACYAQNDALAAHARFQKSYLAQKYSDRPGQREIAMKCRHILSVMLGKNGGREIVNHPAMRYHTIVSRCRGPAAIDDRFPQTLGILAAMLSNVVSPAFMRPFIERFLFHHPKRPPIDFFPHLPVHRIPLTEKNVDNVLLATGAVPMVISGIKRIHGAPDGTYRDGALTDYHFDLPVLPREGFVLYPHFSPQPPIPGWFDKRLPWRKASRENYRRTIILSPSREFISTLPGGRVPDRSDFYAFKYSERRRRWERVLSACEQLGEALSDIDSRKQWASAAEPLQW